MSFIADLGLQLGGQAIGAGLGMAMQGQNDSRQLGQQQKLLNQKSVMDKSMTDYNYSKQLQMWKDTGYKAQMEQMKGAGLNPAMMYGMSGGGGGTVGGGGGSQVSSADAPKGGGEAMGMAMQNANLALLHSQKENIDADTRNKTAGAVKTGGVDTQKVEAEIPNIQQETKNKQAQESLTNTQGDIAKVDLRIKDESADAQIADIQKNWQVKSEMLQQMVRNNHIGAETMNTQIMQIKQNYALSVVEQGLKEMQTKVGASNIQVNEQDIKTKAANIVQRWQEISTGNVNAANGTTNAESGRINARVGEQGQKWNEYIKDVPESIRMLLDKLGGVLGKL